MFSSLISPFLLILIPKNNLKAPNDLAVTSQEIKAAVNHTESSNDREETLCDQGSLLECKMNLLLACLVLPLISDRSCSKPSRSVLVKVTGAT